MSESGRRTNSPHLWALLLIPIVIAAAMWLRMPKPPGPRPPNGEVTTPIDPVRAIELNNDALALLENGQYDAAAEKFGALHKTLHDEPSVRVNWAIASILAIAPEALDKTRDPEKFQSGRARAAAATEQLGQTSAIGKLLTARLAEHQDSRVQVIDHLDAAAKLADGDPAFEVEIYLASRADDDQQRQDRGVAALKRAGEKAPDNLWLLTELVVAQAMAKDVSVATTLARLKQSSQPFVEMIQTLRKINMLDLFTKAEAAVSQEDWNTVTRNARLVSNLLKPEIATKLDQRRVVKHLLEYVVHDFTEEWSAQHAAALASSTSSSPSVNISFAEAAAADQLPPLAGIRDVKIADFDLDGRWDVIVLLSGQVIVFGQSGAASEGRWTTLCEAVVPSGMNKLVACDLDRDTEETPDEHRFIGQPKTPAEKAPDGAAERVEDADIDLLVYGDDGVLFVRNVFDKENKTRSLESVSQDAAFEALRGVLAIVPTDIDHDGDLDLVISSGSGMSIWQNNDSREHTKFTDISARSALPPSDLKATVLLPVDWNFDVQTDVLVTGPDVAKPGYLENISHGRLRWREWPASELNIANVQSLYLQSLQQPRLLWDLLGPRSGRGLRQWDFDNDGRRDRLSWNAQNVFRKEFSLSGDTPELSLVGTAISGVNICEIADLDNDGDEDVLIITDQRPIWIRNDGGNKNGWIDLSIRADKDRKPQRDSERVNIHGLGSLLEVRAAGLPELPGRKSHIRVVEGQSTHFGLGSVKQVDAARIVWTNGIPQNILHPKAGQPIAAQQILKGSCPYLYTWDGEQFAFYTDCLWTAPIGLQLAEGVLAPSREWEYLKIDGDRLHEVDGEYRLMLTEELWEAAYFDQVRLLAVDHPADIEIYTNEKVGPPSISEFKLHPVRQRHVPVAAHDHRGRDVLAKIARRDEQYLRAFDKIIQQGLAEEHFIELDLGDLQDAHSVTLFLTGWIFPTDTSINVSLSQNPDRDAPKPPAIWVVDEAGNAETQNRGDAEKAETKWRVAIPYIGFPGGKTKTIAIDVSEALGLGKREISNSKSQISDFKSKINNQKSKINSRLRIVTSMELYWDEMFFTVDEPPAEFPITEMPMLSADLQYRGFSARLPHPEFGPERFDASNVTTAPQWPPMGGKFTRYGDVTELLTESDDRLAIFGAGDAVTIRFRVNQPQEKLPLGWKRDFVLHNVGWDKDADLNTIYGQFVEPLPFRAMRGYPDPTGTEFPDTPTHRDYLRRFQTREQNRKAFWIGPHLECGDASPLSFAAEPLSLDPNQRLDSTKEKRLRRK